MCIKDDSRVELFVNAGEIETHHHVGVFYLEMDAASVPQVADDSRRIDLFTGHEVEELANIHPCSEWSGSFF